MEWDFGVELSDPTQIRINIRFQCVGRFTGKFFIILLVFNKILIITTKMFIRNTKILSEKQIRNVVLIDSRWLLQIGNVSVL